MTAVQLIDSGAQDPLESEHKEALAGAKAKLEELHAPYESAREAVETAEKDLQSRMDSICEKWLKKYPGLQLSEEHRRFQEELRLVAGLIQAGHSEISSPYQSAAQPRQRYLDEQGFHEWATGRNVIPDAVHKAADGLDALIERLEQTRRNFAPLKTQYDNAAHALADLQLQSPEAFETDISTAERELGRLKKTATANIEHIESLQTEIENLRVAELQADHLLTEGAPAQKEAKSTLDKAVARQTELQGQIDSSKNAQRVLQRRIAESDENLAGLRDQRNSMLAAMYTQQIAAEERGLVELFKTKGGAFGRVDRINELRSQLNDVLDGGSILPLEIRVKVERGHSRELSDLERMSIGRSPPS